MRNYYCVSYIKLIEAKMYYFIFHFCCDVRVINFSTICRDNSPALAIGQYINANYCQRQTLLFSLIVLISLLTLSLSVSENDNAIRSCLVINDSEYETNTAFKFHSCNFVYICRQLRYKF